MFNHMQHIIRHNVLWVTYFNFYITVWGIVVFYLAYEEYVYLKHMQYILQIDMRKLTPRHFRIFFLILFCKRTVRVYVDTGVDAWVRMLEWMPVRMLVRESACVRHSRTNKQIAGNYYGPTKIHTLWFEQRSLNAFSTIVRHSHLIDIKSRAKNWRDLKIADVCCWQSCRTNVFDITFNYCQNLW